MDVLEAAKLVPQTLHPLEIIGPGERRRVDLIAKQYPAEFVFGFHQKDSRRLMNIFECQTVTPAIRGLLRPLHDLLKVLLGVRQSCHVFVVEADNGLDLLLAGLKTPLTDEWRQQLKDFATANTLTRFQIKVKRAYEVLYERETPYVTFADQKISVSPNCFLQACKKTDALFSRWIERWCPEDSRHIADLFCGRGTLSFPLTRLGKYVSGYECDKHALKAIEDTRPTHLSVQDRNLFTHPLTAPELKVFNAVVLNPPRAGAEAQMAPLGDSTVNHLFYVSCNPQTFARDAHILCAHGFTLKDLVPIDQFMWSDHMELIGIFER